LSINLNRKKTGITVDPGNVPVYLGRSARPALAVEQILLSKTCDTGIVGTSK